MGWMSHRKWKEIKQQPSMLPGPALSGCCLISLHFLWAIHPICPVYVCYFIWGFTLKGHIGSLIYLLYKWFYFKTGYFISGFYCSRNSMRVTDRRCVRPSSVRVLRPGLKCGADCSPSAVARALRAREDLSVSHSIWPRRRPRRSGENGEGGREEGRSQRVQGRKEKGELNVDLDTVLHRCGCLA